MSSKQNDINDINNTINHGNCEEFFILYIDNELSNEQMKMVDDFLIINHDLQVEFEILMSTKLPIEKFSFNKEALMAESMKIDAVDEELLLYIDNELPSEKRKIVELELDSNKNYLLQYQLLLKTRLDVSEKLVYPHKEELYHRRERIIPFKLWMSVAATIIVIAAISIFYFINSSLPTHNQLPVATTNTQPSKNKNLLNQIINPQKPSKNIVVTNLNKKENKDERFNKKDQKNIADVKKKVKKRINSVHEQDEKTIAFTDVTINDPIVRTNEPINTKMNASATASISIANKDFLNNHNVTSVIPERTINTDSNDGSVTSNNNNHKGSIKGLLRKATRMIEKRTGFDPADDNELLIGVVAVKLK